MNVQKVVVGLSKSDPINEIELYPNPAIHQVFLTSAKPIVKAIVYDIQGRLINTIEGNSTGRLSIDIQSLQSGLYFMTVKTTEGEVLMRFTKS